MYSFLFMVCSFFSRLKESFNGPSSLVRLELLPSSRLPMSTLPQCFDNGHSRSVKESRVMYHTIESPCFPIACPSAQLFAALLLFSAVFFNNVFICFSLMTCNTRDINMHSWNSSKLCSNNITSKISSLSIDRIVSVVWKLTVPKGPYTRSN